MRRFSVLLLGSLVGCASTPPSPTTTVSFIPGSDVIQVIVHNEQPVRGIQLVAPDGTVTHATSINTDRLIEPSGSSVGVGIGGFGFGRGGGFGSSVGVGLPVGGGGRPVDTVTSASIQVAPAYRADWQHYHIEVLVGEPSKIISLAAPQPS
jgi:hypothetical protein